MTSNNLNPINDYTTGSQYNYNPTNYSTFPTRGQALADTDLSVNAQKEYMTFSQALPGSRVAMPGQEFYDIFSSDDIGVVSEVRDYDQDNLMRVLFRKRMDSKTADGNYMEAAKDVLDTHSWTSIEMAAANMGKPLVEMFRENYGTQIPVQYIPATNGNQLEKWGTIIGHGTPDDGFRRYITPYTIQAWDSEENTGTSVTAIPATDPEETTNLYFPSRDSGFFASGQCDCQPLTGKCSNGYRIAWITKKANMTPGSKPQREMVAITNVVVNPLGDGGTMMTIRRGLGKGNIQDTGSGDRFTEGLPLPIEAGDTILFGPVVPSTQCLPKVCCTKAFPKPYQYCSVTQAMTDCVFEDKPHIRLTQQKDRFSWQLEEKLDAAQKIRDFMYKLYYNIMFGQHTFDKGQRTPVVVDDAGNVEYTECDSIPSTTRGMLQTIDQYGFLDEHYFTSCGDQCGQYKLARIHELRMRSMANARVLKKNGWMLVGDSKELAKYQNQLISTNFVANNPQTAQLQQNMQNSGFSNSSAKSMLGSMFNTPAEDVDILHFQGRDVITINDSSFKNMGMEGTLYWMNIDNGLTIFTRDNDALVNMSAFSSTNPYFPTTAVRGYLVPYLYSQSLTPTEDIMNGTVRMQSKSNCGYRIDAYMEYGVHVKAAYLPHSGRFRYGAKVSNPDFDPETAEGPANPEFIYTTLDALDCSCGSAETAIADAYTGWANGNITYTP